MQQKGSHAVNSHMRSKHHFREKDLEHTWQTWSLDWQRFSFLALKRFNLKLILLASFNFYILYLIISPKNPTKYKMRIFLTESHYKCSRIRNRIQLLILLVISRSEADLDKKNRNTIIHLVSRDSVTSSNLSSIWKIPSSSCPSKGSISSSFTADGGRSCASVFTVLSAHLVKQKRSEFSCSMVSKYC